MKSQSKPSTKKNPIKNVFLAMGISVAVVASLNFNQVDMANFTESESSEIEMIQSYNSDLPRAKFHKTAQKVEKSIKEGLTIFNSKAES